MVWQWLRPSTQTGNEHKTTEELYQSHAVKGNEPKIRILRLQRRSPSSALECSLETARLDSQPSYDTISYVWGSAQDPAVINVDGTDIEITQNLESALRSLWEIGHRRYIWVDAICINQADLEERSQQVQIMDRIYEQSARVWCCLGPAINSYDQVLASLDTTRISQSALSVKSRAEARSIQDLFLDTSITQKHLEAVQYMSQCVYWQRTWIIQELVLAKHISVLFGSRVIPWATLDDLMALIWSRRSLTGHSHRADLLDKLLGLKELSRSAVARLVRQRFELPDPDPGIAFVPTQILADFRGQYASDPRDKIYGFLGLQRRSSSADIGMRADYTKPFADVYREFAMRCLERTGRLEHVLCHAGEYQRSEFPSWIPDWRAESHAGLRRLVEIPGLYAAGGKDAGRMQFPSISTLAVRGTSISAIVEFCAADLWSLESFLFTRLPPTHAAGIPPLEALFRTFLRDVASSPAQLPVRLANAPDRWRSLLAVGFLGMLGSGIDCRSVSPLDDGHDQHMVVRSFKHWMSSCVRYIDRLLSGIAAPVVADRDGRVAVARVHEPVLSGDEQGRGQVALCKNTEFLEAWRTLFQKALESPTLHSTLAPLLGTPGEASPLNLEDMAAVFELSDECTNAFSGRAWGADRTFFVAEGLYYGLGPCSLRRGDLVCILYGCSVPVVLRPHENGFKLISECYMLGFMDGEALELIGRGEAEESVFNIS